MLVTAEHGGAGLAHEGCDSAEAEQRISDLGDVIADLPELAQGSAELLRYRLHHALVGVFGVKRTMRELVQLGAAMLQSVRRAIDQRLLNAQKDFGRRELPLAAAQECVKHRIFRETHADEPRFGEHEANRRQRLGGITGCRQRRRQVDGAVLRIHPARGFDLTNRRLIGHAQAGGALYGRALVFGAVDQVEPGDA